MRLCSAAALLVVFTSFSGCWLAVVGIGAEAGYVDAQDQRTASETLTDQYLTTAVKTALIADSEVSGLDVNVDSFRGVITLRGALQSDAQIDRAIQVAQSVRGVLEVQSKLVVVP